MKKFMITLTKIKKSQQEIHDYYSKQADIVITQLEHHKTGAVHYHVYISTYLTKEDVLDLTYDFNTPINDDEAKYKNNVKEINDYEGTMKYLMKEGNTPLLKGIDIKDIKKAVNRYKNRSKSKKQIVKAEIRKTSNKIQSLYDEVKEYVKKEHNKYLEVIMMYRDEIAQYMNEDDQEAVDRVTNDLIEFREKYSDYFMDNLIYYKNITIPNF